MNNFETVIGIEIHVELNTKTKMFSSAKNDFDSSVNTNVSHVDIAYPGALPVVNKEAVAKAIKLAKALNMKIDDVLHFDRKNYYYPDLPKGFQITQDERPIGSEGTIRISNKEIQIERIHLEEDTAKSIHKDGKTFINYNRAGVPLIEIVTHPVMSNGKEASEYVQAIRDLVVSLGISDAKMEEGSLRADINISLRPRGQKEFGTKVEIKNLNSIGNIQKSIELEIKKQTAMLLTGEEIKMATKRFDEASQDTITMRVKTGVADYKFFAEPNIPPIQLTQEFIDSIKLDELPWERLERYKGYGLSEEHISNLSSNLEQAKYFDLIKYEDKTKVANLFFAELVSLANANNKTVTDLNVNPNEFAEILFKLDSGEISGKHAKEIFPLLIDSKQTVSQIIEEKGMKQISDEKILNEMLEGIITSNNDFIVNNKERPERVSKFILGQLMKESKGQANPVVANKLVNKRLED